MRDPESTVRRFVELINAHDVAGLAALMTDDHLFVDALGVEQVGRKAMRKGWSSYLEAFPDYEITVHKCDVVGDEVTLSGTAKGTFAGDPEGDWTMPAAWKAIVRDGLVAEWRVVRSGEDEP